MNYRERIRKAIACPQFGNETYGEWGILNLEQRKYIKRLLDELDSADNYIKNLYLENQKLKENYERIYNENCKLREEHNITDISLLDENYKLKDNWNELKKWLRIKDILANSKINPQSIKFKDLLKHMEYLEKKR